MGNHLWGALVRPVARLEVAGVTHWKFTRAAVEFLHVYDPSNWVVLPFSVTRLADHGLVLRQTGGSKGVPLAVHTLRAGFHQCLGRPTHEPNL